MALTGTLLAMLAATGCVSSGLGLGADPDRTVVTGSISAIPSALTDDDIIRLTVADADISKGSAQQLPWTNLTSGDGGVVTFVRENGKAGQTCREFVVSKHSYDGVAQYLGEICRADAGRDWTLISMERQD